MNSSRRGRRRNSGIDEAIRAATLDLLLDVGFDALTIEAVAGRAGVGRPTVYRRASTKAALVADAMAATLALANPYVAQTGDVRDDLAHVLRSTARGLDAGVFGNAVAEVVGPSRRDEALAAALDTAVRMRRDLMRELVEEAAVQGRLRTDVEAAMDILLGAIYYRHIVGRTEVDGAYVERILSAVVDDGTPVGADQARADRGAPDD